jgi:hypothetical protein
MVIAPQQFPFAASPNAGTGVWDGALMPVPVEDLQNDVGIGIEPNGTYVKIFLAVVSFLPIA